MAPSFMKSLSLKPYETFIDSNFVPNKEFGVINNKVCKMVCMIHKSKHRCKIDSYFLTLTSSCQ